nr:immunoglobulin heavy chain junction region [Mus musculus]MBK4188064.1 immunoglobulin heavy chain junction region [Mus musculus]MBK4188065.1 immunoglobulin heavy chain junction region [Mus musculus]MBK4188066.1 immunoglobulin heavy chain junction region [Mus musculus]MBK4188067.1 immunoglobulin heavy chain junction region [Mus musculus]
CARWGSPYWYFDVW